MSCFEQTGFYPADILLPVKGSMEKWAVVACDQFTSEPEYWEKVEEIVGDAPSAFRMILPEAHLADPNVDEMITKINRNMEAYLEQGVFEVHENSMIYVERTQSDGRVRKGLIGKIDLEQYDFTPGNKALVRATEGTVLERIPPRVRVREHAPVELPHVMLLIDDPGRTVIEPLGAADDADWVYDFDLMQAGGHIRGRLLSSKEQEAASAALCALMTPESMESRYGMKDAAPLLFAVGDGNHSLATAKRCYEDQKAVTPPEQWASLPSRYALVEVVNNHDDALGFEPIHRVIFDVDKDALMNAFAERYPDVSEEDGPGHVIRYCDESGEGILRVPDPKLQLTVGTLQSFLDDFLKEHPAQIDYIHGDETTRGLGKQHGNMAFLLPAMAKSELFKTVMADGVLPRKTFSMGHAQDKRYYLEARRIR